MGPERQFSSHSVHLPGRRQLGVSTVQVLLGAAVLSAAGLGAYVLTQKTPAPDVTYKLIDGQSHTTASLRGQVYLVNFWATSCATCIKEFPDIAATYGRYRDQGFRTIAVAMSYDRPDFVLNFVKTRQLPFEVALDVDGSAAKGFGDVKMTPTTFLVDRQGNIVKRWLGEPDFAVLNALIEKALAG